MGLTASLPVVRKFTEDDEYHYTVENRVSDDLEARDNAISTRVDSLTDHSVQSPATGFSIVITNSVPKLILDLAGDLATGTIELPSSPYDSYSVTISSTHTITALTLDPSSGHAIKNAVTTLSAGSSITYTFHSENNTWYRT